MPWPDLRKKQYSDFIKGLTPVFFAVLKFYLKNKCRLDIDEDYSNGKKGKSWNSAKIHTNLDLLDCLQKDYKDFNFGTIYADHLVAIALDQRFNQDFAYKTIVQDLNEKIMKRIRNEVAHEIMPVTEEKINAMTGLTPQKIFDLFIKYIENSGVRIPDGAWNSYDDMNDKIKSYLEI
ncbi:MAG: hypothetical protein LBQ96_02940 [Fusobacteriaceae bacterium]|jgi:hypothetical protein|nr:hypothetical protein [Fusobacteriaceae bacterium]